MEPAHLFSLILVQPLSMPNSLKRSPEGIGVGIYMGTPTGLGALNLSYREKDITRQAYLNWNLTSEQFRGVVDQVWELKKITLQDGTQFPLYAGGRVWFRFNDISTTLGLAGFSNSIGVGTPIGALYQHEEVGVEAYLEIAPVFQISPISQFGTQFGFGVRFYPAF